MKQEIKEWWKSKTMWLNIVTLIIAILAGFQDALVSGTVLTTAAVLNIILRAITKAELKK